MQREPVTMTAVCTADPQPHVSWLLNGVELTPDATIKTKAETQDIEHGLKECTFTLNIPTGNILPTTPISDYLLYASQDRVAFHRD